MKQVVQEVRSGVTAVRDIPAPLAPPHHVLIATAASLVSAGTERYVVELARKSLLGKARQRPDQVRRVLEKVRDEGLMTTLQQVQAKLDEPMPLGYSAAGTVVAAGSGVQRFKVGDRVAAAVPHAEMAAAGENLCARVPDAVSFEQAAYTSVAAIALEGVRLARVQLGDRVLVIGLGLIGQICVALLKAQGCRVFGTDIDAARFDLARAFGADVTETGSPLESTRAFSGGHGVDAVLITAATTSNEPVEFAAEACRHRGRIVLVGVAGLNLPRPPFFQKELEFTVSSSLGPGRGDPRYEEKGVDYPIGFARWTAQRNMEAVLALMADGKLPVEKLTTHRFPIGRAADAYTLITSGAEPFTGIVIEYPQPADEPRRRLELRAPGPASGATGVSVIGAGNFARLFMLPGLAKLDGLMLRGLCTAKGMSAEHSGRGSGFAFATTDADEIWNDPATATVFLATRHDLHASLVMAALRAGKHVFVEKPLCIHPEELEQIARLVEELGERCPLLTVGFNRRFAPATLELSRFFRGIMPLSISHRFAPGPVPADHWTQDEDIGGGRIVGEACHAIDTCTAIAGSPPVRVYAESVGNAGALRTTDDRLFITLRHANGSISSVSYQAGGDRAAPAERIEVSGGGRSAAVENWDRVELWHGGRKRSVNGAKDKGHRAELAAFIDACRTGGPAPIPWNDVYSVTWASLMAVRSLREGCPFDMRAGDS
jgi:predicted dehydrogenase